MRERRPILLPDGGLPLCTLTHADDFAATFVRLLADPRTYGESVHITSDESISWRQAFDAIATVLGVCPDYASVPSEEIAARDRSWGEILLGDRAHSSIFDNSKVRSLVPQHLAGVRFSEGARQIVEWHDRTPSAQIRDTDREELMDELIARRRAL